VIRQALRNGGVDAGSVSYVECHGTGTPLGDPIEVQALASVYGEGRTKTNAIRLGSVKTNIGHTEGAAGVASVIKVILSLRNELLPASLHFDEPNPHIPWNDLPVTVNAELSRWPQRADSSPRRAGVSSFGFSGTNAHVILEEAPVVEVVVQENAQASEASAYPVLISGQSEAALVEQAARLKAHVESQPEQVLKDLAYSLATTRTHFVRRVGLVARNRAELLSKLAAIEGRDEKTAEPGVVGKLAFLFTGQGSQLAGMGKDLYSSSETFREGLDLCAAQFDKGLKRPLLEVMFADEGSDASKLLDQTGYAQPALFALEWALVQVWQSWGVVPDAVMGHSIGEIVAACVAGVFSLEDACRLVLARGQLMQALPAGGAMVSVEADEATIRSLLVGKEEKVSIAAINGPKQVVVSGERAAVAEVVSALEKQKVRTKKLEVSHAFHSPLMAPMLDEFGKVAARVVYHRPKTTLISNLTGKRVDEDVCEASSG
jgi:epothilone polyketide synthase A